MKLLDGFNTAAIAYLYYKKQKPHKKYNRNQAKFQFRQDANISIPVLKEVIAELYMKQQAKLS